MTTLRIHMISARSSHSESWHVVCAACGAVVGPECATGDLTLVTCGSCQRTREFRDPDDKRARAARRFFGGAP